MPLAEDVVPLVRRTFGSDTTVVGSQTLGNWAVAQLQLHTSDGPTPVVKWLRANPNRADPRQMITEAVGLQFAGELAPGLVTRVIASEFDHATGGVLLLEDLSPAGHWTTSSAEGVWNPPPRLAEPLPEPWADWPASTDGHDQVLQERLGRTSLMDPLEARLRILGPPWERVHS